MGELLRYRNGNKEKVMDSFYFNVKGIMYRPKKTVKLVAEYAGMDDVLELKREPSNKYDSNAVKVFYDGEWIGYVERDLSEQISELLELDKDFECKVVSCYADWDSDITDSGREVEFVTDIDLLAEIIIP